jgi:hypothetical protein
MRIYEFITNNFSDYDYRIITNDFTQVQSLVTKDYEDYIFLSLNKENYTYESDVKLWRISVTNMHNNEIGKIENSELVDSISKSLYQMIRMKTSNIHTYFVFGFDSAANLSAYKKIFTKVETLFVFNHTDVDCSRLTDMTLTFRNQRFKGRFKRFIALQTKSKI